MSNSVRFYSFRVVSYASLDELDLLFKSAFKLAYILHDKDIYSSSDDCPPEKIGTLKSPHYHILCTFKQNKTFKAIRDMVVSEHNTFVQPMQDKYSDFEYLNHSNAPDKYQYPFTDIICNDLSFFSGATTKNISNDEFLNDICNPAKTHRELAVKYGRDYIKNYKAYHEFAQLVRDEDLSCELGYPATSSNCFTQPAISLMPYSQFEFDYLIALDKYYRDIFGDEIADKLFPFERLSFFNKTIDKKNKP